MCQCRTSVGLRQAQLSDAGLLTLKWPGTWPVPSDLGCWACITPPAPNCMIEVGNPTARHKDCVYLPPGKRGVSTHDDTGGTWWQVRMRHLYGFARVGWGGGREPAKCPPCYRHEIRIRAELRERRHAGGRRPTRGEACNLGGSACVLFELSPLRVVGVRRCYPCRARRDLRSRVNGTEPGRDGPPLVRAVDDGGSEPAVQDASQAEQEGGDPCGALHP